MIAALNALTTRADGQPLCRSGRRVRTWGEWRAELASLMEVLHGRSGQTWALYASDSYDFLIGLYALWGCGKTPVIPPMNSTAATAMLASVVDDFLGEFAGALEIRQGGPSSARVGDISDDVELLMYTSGSSGEPKAVPKRLAQLQAEVSTLEALWGADFPEATTIATVTHQHMYGLLFKVLWPLAAGRPFQSEIIHSLQNVGVLSARYGRTVWVTSPAQLKRLPFASYDADDAAQVCMAFSAGGPLPNDVAHRFAECFAAAPVEIYGTTEAGAIAYRQQRLGHESIPFTAAPKIAVTADAAGQLLIRSPHLPDQEWHPTGDIGEVFDDARFELRGRADSIVKIEEKRVSLTAIERFLDALPEVEASRCVVLHGRRDVVAAVVILARDGERGLQEMGKVAYTRRLRACLAGRVETVALPRRWRFVEAFPQNERGKIAHADLVSLFDGRDLKRLPFVTHVDQRSADEVVVNFQVPHDLSYFPGHFPGNPVLPGVVQLLWVEHFAERYLGTPRGARRMEMIKFKKLVLPGTEITLALKLSADGRKVLFSNESPAGVCSSGRLVVGD